MDKYKLIENEENTKTREYLLNKAMKLKSLLSSPEEGEREAANTILSNYMTKHNITWEELDDQSEREYLVKYGEEYNIKLLFQIVYKYVGAGHVYIMYDKQTDKQLNSAMIKCKPSDFIEIQLDWEFYWSMFQKELNMFYKAFVEQNHIFPPEELQKESDQDDNQDLTDEEIKKIRKLMKGVDSYTRSKPLETGTKELHE